MITIGNIVVQSTDYNVFDANANSLSSAGLGTRESKGSKTCRVLDVVEENVDVDCDDLPSR